MTVCQSFLRCTRALGRPSCSRPRSRSARRLDAGCWLSTYQVCSLLLKGWTAVRVKVLFGWRGQPARGARGRLSETVRKLQWSTAGYPTLMAISMLSDEALFSSLASSQRRGLLEDEGGSACQCRDSRSRTWSSRAYSSLESAQSITAVALCGGEVSRQL
jgi:hypothetical protein